MSLNQRVVTWMVCSTFSLASASVVLAADVLGPNTSVPGNTPSNLPVQGPADNSGGARQTDGDATGLRLGSFLLSFETEAGITYTDNANYSNTNKSSDRIYSLTTAFGLRSDWSRHALGIGASLERNFYEKNSSENGESVSLSGDVRIDVTRDTNIELGAEFNLGQEERNSIDANTDAISPTDTYNYAAHIGVNHKINRLTLSMRGSLEAFEYDNTLLNNGTFEDNSDREYVDLGGTAKIAYEISPKTAVYSELSYTDRTYDREVDDNGDIRNSQAYGITVGVVTEITRSIKAQAAVGYREARFDDPNFDKVDAVVFDASLIWTPTPLTQVTASFSTGLDATSVSGSSGAITRTVSIDASHDLRENIKLNAKASVELAEYDGLSLEETTYTGSLGVDYSLGRKTTVTAQYSYEKFESNTSGDDYEVNTLGVRLTYKD